MCTILDKEMAGKEVEKTEFPESPRGNKDWKMMHLSNGEIAMVSLDTRGRIPQWVKAYLSKQMGKFSIRRAGGTTRIWSGWMVKPEKNKFDSS